MNQFKQIAFYYIITFLIFNIECAGSEHLGERAAKIAGQAIEKSTQIAVDAGIEVTKIAADTSIEITKIAAPAIVETAQKIGSDAAQKIGSDATGKVCDALKNAAIIVTVAQVGIKVVELGKDGYSYLYPSEKEKQSNEKAARGYNLLKTEREFRECLTKNGKAKRDQAGVPIVCVDQACNLAMAGGEEKLERLTKTFNKYYKQDKDL